MTLSVYNLTYRLNKRSLIEKISVEFKAGVLYGILGPNGSGKSTLLKTISRLWTPTSGDLHWNKKNLLQFSRLDMSQTLSMVPQNPLVYFDFSVHQMVAMGRYAQGSRTPEAYEQIKIALKHVNAWHLRDRMISELSGGERQRIYIARALVTQAPILLLDEPTSHLDLRHQLEIWQLLRHLTIQGKLIIVAVHDLIAAQRYCDEIVILQRGRCRAFGPFAATMTASLLQDVFGVSKKESSEIYELCSLY